MAAAVCCAAAGGADCEYCEYCEYCGFIWCADGNNYPCCNFSPEPNQTATSKPTGYTEACRGVAHQGEDGRPHTPLINLTVPTSLMQAPRPRTFAYRRCHQKSPAYPCGTSTPEPTPTAACKPTGYIVTPLSCQTSQTGQTQTSRPRNTHTAVAITE